MRGRTKNNMDVSNDRPRAVRSRSGSQHSHASIRFSSSIGRLAPTLTQLHADDGLGFQMLQREAEGWFPLFMSTGTQPSCPSPQGPLSGRPRRLKTTIAIRPKPNLRKATAMNRTRENLLEKKRPERGPNHRRKSTEPRVPRRARLHHRKSSGFPCFSGKHQPQRPPLKRQPNFGPSRYCHTCGTTATPQWRQGPDGLDTLCNMCGLIWGKRCTADYDLVDAEECHVILSPRVVMAKRQGLRWNPPTGRTATEMKSDDVFFGPAS